MPVSADLPLFPLGTVLFPGLVLPLRVFEERYRALVRHIRDLPDGTPREFGVVAIRRGWETGEGFTLRPGAGLGGAPDHTTRPPASIRPPADAQPSAEAATLHPDDIYDIGCTAQIRQITEHPDGRFDLVTVGVRRFAVERLDTSAKPYLVAHVHWLTDSSGAATNTELDDLASGVLALFQRYLRLLRPQQPGEQLPDDPTVLSHVIAATTALPLPERQALLAAPDTTVRLRQERTLLAREVAFLSRVRAVPVPLPEIAVTTSPN